MAEREGIECRPKNLMPTPAIPVQCNPSLLHALQFAPAERTSTVQAASAQIMANERICNKIAQICNNPARSFTASISLYVHSHASVIFPRIFMYLHNSILMYYITWSM